MQLVYMYMYNTFGISDKREILIAFSGGFPLLLFTMVSLQVCPDYLSCSLLPFKSQDQNMNSPYQCYISFNSSAGILI